MDKHYMDYGTLLNLIMDKLVENSRWLDWDNKSSGMVYHVRYGKKVALRNLSFAQLCQIVGLM